jgi:hypothetical protein
MKKKLLILAGMVAAMPLVQAGDITGKITVTGNPPAPVVNESLKNDAFCSKLRTEPAMVRLFLTGPGATLGDVVVYLKDPPKKDNPAPAKDVVLDQVGCEYVPYVFAMQKGQKLVIRNSDPVMHNVNMSAAKANKPFNEAQMPKAPDKTKMLEPEVFIPFKCDVHPWMFAYGSVFDHPYFAVSGKDGTYKIANVPAGKYTLEVRHRKLPVVSKEITVGADGTTADVTLEYKAP